MSDTYGKLPLSSGWSSFPPGAAGMTVGEGHVTGAVTYYYNASMEGKSSHNSNDVLHDTKGHCLCSRDYF